VTPDGTILICTGADTSVYGYPGFIKAFNAKNGNELWQVDLPFQLDPQFRVMGVHHARITPDGSTAYVSTLSLADYPANQDPHTFLYAIDLGGGGEPPPPDPCNHDGVCTLGEDCKNCPSDCPGVTGGKPSKRWCCGDAVCSDREDSDLCPLDCGPAPECGDGVCQSWEGETACSCEPDCGAPPANEIGLCTDVVDNDCDYKADCADDDCSTDPLCLCLPKNVTCSVDDDCCSGVCKANGRCR